MSPKRNSPVRLAACAALGLALTGAPAHAIVGGADVGRDDHPNRWTVMIEGPSGRLCSGVAISLSLVLTAAHCAPGGQRLSVGFLPADGGALRSLPVIEIVRHPTFRPDQQPRFQTGVDLALLRVGGDLPRRPDDIEMDWNDVALKAEVHVFGFGASEEADLGTARVLRGARLEHVGQYRHSSGSTAQFAQDPETKAERPGRGACNGDSGGPVVTGALHKASLVGIVSWSTGPTAGTRCGGYTAFVPLSAHADWVTQAASEMDRRSAARP